MYLQLINLLDLDSPSAPSVGGSREAEMKCHKEFKGNNNYCGRVNLV